MGTDWSTVQLPDYTFGINQTLPHLDSGWQAFPGHYLLYASDGTFTLEVEDRQWILPPQRAAWVQAGVQIHIYAKKPIISSSILFNKDSIPTPPLNCCVFAVTPLAREMIIHATRWDIQRDANDKAADLFFSATASVCLELATTAEQFWLPRPRSGELGAAMGYIFEHLPSPLTVEEIAQAVNVSGRTLARRFVDEANITCGRFIHHARMLRAMELLAEYGTSIIDVAYSVGFESVSSFTTAFRRFTQETPTQYRRRFFPE
jgi:AraC-like DNA-binding protein